MSCRTVTGRPAARVRMRAEASEHTRMTPMAGNKSAATNPIGVLTREVSAGPAAKQNAMIRMLPKNTSGPMPVTLRIVVNTLPSLSRVPSTLSGVLGARLALD